MVASNTHLTVVGSTKPGASPASPELDIEVIEQNVVDEALKKVTTEIDKIKAMRDGNTYRSAITFIADSETRISRKDPSSYNKELGILLEKFKEWKTYVGSEICVLLEIALHKQQETFQNNFFLPEEVIEEMLSFSKDETLKWAKVKFETTYLLGFSTRWGIKFNPKTRITSVPTELKTSWAGEKWKVPELLVLVDLLNLMFLKIELLSVRSIVVNMKNLWLNVHEILKGGTKF